ncbi:saccharopine dehydrogenase family protein [Litoribrevibacter euphylliae]|uniref:Saccharopine dehydrogenase family protein n=1 Tax=Litoribrevibacter euphylliae TaxID=1834034 RepID=A0ABV7HGG7_9GAMM
MTILIYGAYGYSGRLITEEACKQGLDVQIAGRNESKLAPIASQFNLKHHAVSLDDGIALRALLKTVQLVIHCAGPFSATAKPMIEACIETGTHYLDITGEVSVFEYVHSSEVDRRATEAGIILCPGVGFDVIPTDCVASKLKEVLPDAEQLILAFAGGNALSPGTAKTMVESFGVGLQVRQDGKIITVPFREKDIDFGSGEKSCMAISWGDVSTAYHSTGIPNIDVYVPASSNVIRGMKLLRGARWLFKPKFAQKLLQSKIEHRVEGPSANVRSANPSSIYGEAVNARGKRIQARLKTLNGYDVTKYGAIEVAKRILNEGSGRRGSITPSLLCGNSLASEIPGSSPIEIYES